jgi:hypothetical protein
LKEEEGQTTQLKEEEGQTTQLPKEKSKNDNNDLQTKNQATKHQG